MILGLIADSHDHMVHLGRAAKLFRAAGVTRVIHAGDMVSPAAIRVFEGFPVAAVFGNNDGERLGLVRTVTAMGGRLDGDFLQLDIGALRLAVYHGTVPPLTESLIRGGLYRIVVHGHSHRVSQQRVGDTLALNPGTAHGYGGPATAMVFDAAAQAVQVLDLT
ncbi:MAG: YfcE family phosphodiesterase [Magnetococcales bacterium]|nr:YfcE family phosphodiesterase [Magnetococcales bacterium]